MHHAYHDQYDSDGIKRLVQRENIQNNVQSIQIHIFMFRTFCIFLSLTLKSDPLNFTQITKNINEDILICLLLKQGKQKKCIFLS